MTSTVHICFEDENKPANFPNYATIIQRYNEEYPRQTTEINISGVRLSLDKSSDNEVSDLWVKAGVRMGEARTQRYVAQHLQNNAIATVRAPHVYLAFTWCGVGYIVSEYIDGKMCDDSDIPRVAAAVQALISIPTPSPSSAPGPVGGGPIEHPFFIDRTSSIRYESVEELQDHVNGVSVPPCLALSLSRLGCSPADDSQRRSYATQGGRGALNLAKTFTACASAYLT
jgi:hypothetical protein